MYEGVRVLHSIIHPPTRAASCSHTQRARQKKNRDELSFVNAPPAGATVSHLTANSHGEMFQLRNLSPAVRCFVCREATRARAVLRLRAQSGVFFRQVTPSCHTTIVVIKEILFLSFVPIVCQYLSSFALLWWLFDRATTQRRLTRRWQFFSFLRACVGWRAARVCDERARCFLFVVKLQT